MYVPDSMAAKPMGRTTPSQKQIFEKTPPPKKNSQTRKATHSTHWGLSRPNRKASICLSPLKTKYPAANPIPFNTEEETPSEPKSTKTDRSRSLDPPSPPKAWAVLCPSARPHGTSAGPAPLAHGTASQKAAQVQTRERVVSFIPSPCVCVCVWSETIGFICWPLRFGLRADSPGE